MKFTLKNWKKRENPNISENDKNGEFLEEQTDWEPEELEYWEENPQDKKPAENQEKLEKTVEQILRLIVQIIFSIFTLAYCNQVRDPTSNPNPEQPKATSEQVSGETTSELNE